MSGSEVSSSGEEEEGLPNKRNLSLAGCAQQVQGSRVLLAYCFKLRMLWGCKQAGKPAAQKPAQKPRSSPPARHQARSDCLLCLAQLHGRHAAIVPYQQSRIRTLSPFPMPADLW
jgi:hypothetical protein